MFDWFPDAEYYLALQQLVLFMLGMGATLSAADFAAIARRPRFLLVGAACQFVLTPFLAVLLNHVFALPPGVAIGLILVAAMPGGTLSKVFAYLGRGNIALSISLTVAGTFASMATVPLLLTLLATEYVPPDFVMPVGRIVLEVALGLLLPLAVGMTVARVAPVRRLVFSRWCIRLGFVVVAVMVTGSIGSGRVRPAEYGWSAPLAIILFCLASQQLSMLPFRVWGWPRPDCLSAGMEVTMRNLNLAFLLKALLFPVREGVVDPIANGVLFVILYYAGVAMACGAPLALRHRWMARRAERRAAEAARAEVPT